MNPTLCIMGSGNYADQLAQKLLDEGFSVIWMPTFATVLPIPPDAHLAWLPNARLISCQGTIGNFSLSLAIKGKTVSKRAEGILIADAYDARSNLSALGLSPSESIMDHSTFSQMFKKPPSSGTVLTDHRQIAFLNGLHRENHPFVLKDMLQQCLKLQTGYRCQTYLLTRNLKIADVGLEALYHQAKQAGTVFIKLTQTSPSIRQQDGQRVEIRYTDETVRKNFRLKADITVVDQSYFPSRRLKALAQQLHLERDADGFIQADNVHRNGILTNRKGIMAAGPARGILSPAELSSDLTLCAAAAHLLKKRLSAAVKAVVEINTSKCIHCLTCYRICPYRAIELAPAPVINPKACEGCAICKAVCPVEAVDAGASASVNLSAIGIERGKMAAGEFIPRIVAFCCSRSAAEAYRQAAIAGQSMPENLTIIELPCSGALSEEHIYQSFNADIDALAIFTCHPDNCHGHTGNFLAHRNAEHAVKTFTEIGFEPERILIESFAANMGICFAQSIDAFAEKIKLLGPSRLRKTGTESP